MSVHDDERAFDDIEGWRQDEVVRRKARAIVIGEDIADALSEPNSALSILLRQLRESAGNAVQHLIDADLFSTPGIEAARKDQAAVLRFLDLINLIEPLIEAARNAEEADADDMRRLVEQQMEQLHGRPDRFPDA